MTDYNGYNNRFTWLMSLWLSSDFELNILVKKLASESEDSTQLEDRIKDFVEEQNPLSTIPSMYSDIMNHALAEVDYRKIANKYWQERKTNEDNQSTSILDPVTSTDDMEEL